MQEKIHKTKIHLVIEIPLITQRSNPWDESYHPDMPNIIGLIEGENDMGFCYRIDMEYKDKGDQWTDYFYKFFGSPEEFRKLCKKLKIDWIEDWNDREKV